LRYYRSPYQFLHNHILDRGIAIVGVIRRKNENLEFALTLFCEKDCMNNTVDIPHSCSSPEALGPDAARCADLDFSAVEHLLHRLAETQTAKPVAVPTRRPGARKIAALCAVGFVCLSGRAIGPETQPIKADRLPRIAALTDTSYFNDSTYFDEAKMRDEDDSVEQPALRGTVEDIVPPVSAAAPAPRSPSLLEKLFSVFVPEFSQPPSQRQT
jgi:hypothetical protein